MKLKKSANSLNCTVVEKFKAHFDFYLFIN